MKFKTLLIGTITGGAIYFVLGWIAYSVLMNDLIDRYPGESLNKSFRILGYFYYVVAAKLISGFILTLFIIKSGYNKVIVAMRSSLFLGILLNLSNGFIIYSLTTMYSITVIVTDALVFGIISAFAAAGIMVAAGFLDYSLWD